MILKYQTKPQLLVDAGAGEGSYTQALKDHFDLAVGIDNSFDAINLATDYSDCLFLIADLANLPFQDSSVDVLLNILSPANYQEFNRVLKKDGILLKVIANKDYLLEIQAENNIQKTDDIQTHLKENMEIIEKVHYQEQLKIAQEDLQDFLAMSPMTHFKNNDKKLENIDTITLDFIILLAKENQNE